MINLSLAFVLTVVCCLVLSAFCFLLGMQRFVVRTRCSFAPSCGQTRDLAVQLCALLQAGRQMNISSIRFTMAFSFYPCTRNKRKQSTFIK